MYRYTSLAQKFKYLVRFDEEYSIPRSTEIIESSQITNINSVV